ncbi:MAG TPA: ABC transporter ATP-binding protein [Candidatus Sulfopaludibacter sp.]|jgi:molybdate transport system ATP-binding protein|nr:ABC transporter ATP-binding protein [Candidatus Sulfopaludibacter sp.]
MAGQLTCDCALRMVDAHLRVELDEAPVTVLFGPSGAGKSTLLRMLAGLERPTSGRIVFRGETWFDGGVPIDLPPQRRRAGFLFQEYALFPHLTVLENVAYAADRRKAAELLERFGISELAGSKPGSISGGQQQRVALARALAAGPSLLLLDEPLSALDAGTRTRTRRELRRMLTESGIPSIVVTHDRTEAIGLGDTLAVMVAGAIRQTGPVQEVFRRPSDAEVAASVGVENVLPARVAARESGLLALDVAGRQLYCMDGGEAGAVFACVHAEDVVLAHPGSATSSARNRLDGRVLAISLEGPLARVELDCGFPLVALITAQSAAELHVQAGDAICAVVKTTSVHLAS